MSCLLLPPVASSTLLASFLPPCFPSFPLSSLPTFSSAFTPASSPLPSKLPSCVLLSSLVPPFFISRIVCPLPSPSFLDSYSTPTPASSGIQIMNASLPQVTPESKAVPVPPVCTVSKAHLATLNAPAFPVLQVSPAPPDPRFPLSSPDPKVS